MFKKSTVFVLGAGASAPYGFSTGLNLLEKVQYKSAEELATIANEGGFHEKYTNLAVALQHNLTYSIDALLERRSDLVETGKRLMASLLIKQERQSIGGTAQHDGDWIRWVFNQMIEDLPDWRYFADNKISFVTYNYDRLVEYRLLNGLIAAYGIDAVRAQSVLKAIPIVHVHGHIAPLRLRDGQNESGSISFGCSMDTSRREVQEALNCVGKFVKIIHESEGTSDEYEVAKRLIREAEQVLFLGFGFGQRNIERLGLAHMDHEAIRFCSVVGMTDSEINRYVLGAFHPKWREQVGTSAEGLERFLRNRGHIAA